MMGHSARKVYLSISCRIALLLHNIQYTKDTRNCPGSYQKEYSDTSPRNFQCNPERRPYSHPLGRLLIALMT